MRSGNRRIVLPCYRRSCFCCFQQSVSLSCFKQCSYESTPRPFCIHFSTPWYPIALLLNKRSISRSLASALIMNATEPYSLCLCGRGYTSKDALLFTDLFWFFNYCHSSLLLDGLSIHFSQGIFFLILSVHLPFFFPQFWVANCVIL